MSCYDMKVRPRQQASLRIAKHPFERIAAIKLETPIMTKMMAISLV